MVHNFQTKKHRDSTNDSGEVTDRFTIEFFTKFIIHFLTYRVERLFNSEFYCLLVLQMSFRLGGIWVRGRCAAKLIGGRGLFDGSSVDF